MTQEEYNKLNVEEVVTELEEGTLTTQEARAWEVKNRKTVFEAIEILESEASNQKSEVSSQDAASRTPAEILREEALKNYKGETITVKTSDSIPVAMEFIHPITYQSVSKSFADLPDDAWTRGYIGSSTFVTKK